MTESENQIIKGIRTGNEGAFNQLFAEYYKVLSVFANKYVLDLETAKEIVQDFFVHLFESRHKLTITSSLESYLFSSVRNRCLNHLRHQKIHEKHIDVIKHTLETSVDLESKMRATELENQIYQIVLGMPAQCQNIFRMSRVEGKKNGEIANELGISIRTVETQISKALKILRKNIQNYLMS